MPRAKKQPKGADAKPTKGDAAPKAPAGDTTTNPPTDPAAIAAAAEAAEKAKEKENEGKGKKKARVISSFHGHAVNALFTGTAAEVAALKEQGLVDDHPSAIAAAAKE